MSSDDRDYMIQRHLRRQEKEELEDNFFTLNRNGGQDKISKAMYGPKSLRGTRAGKSLADSSWPGLVVWGCVAALFLAAIAKSALT
jgi:hypothetical protein